MRVLFELSCCSNSSSMQMTPDYQNLIWNYQLLVELTVSGGEDKVTFTINYKIIDNDYL
jgi:hypothetical protein